MTRSKFIFFFSGGTYISPVTGLPTPIEIGGFMLEANSDRPVPIIGITVDHSGKVAPVSQNFSLI